MGFIVVLLQTLIGVKCRESSIPPDARLTLWHARMDFPQGCGYTSASLNDNLRHTSISGLEEI